MNRKDNEMRVAYTICRKILVQCLPVCSWVAFFLKVSTSKTTNTGHSRRSVSLRCFAKLNKIQKIQTKIGYAPPHPPALHPNFCFGNPSLTWTEHSNHINQQLLAIHRINIGILLPTYDHWFRAIFGRFSKQTKIHPPTSIVISDFWETILCRAPYLTVVGNSSGA